MDDEVKWMSQKDILRQAIHQMVEAGQAIRIEMNSIRDDVEEILEEEFETRS